MPRISIGYTIKKRTHLMNVTDGRQLWDISMREIGVLLTHYEDVSTLQSMFGTLYDVYEEDMPSVDEIEECKLFSNNGGHGPQTWSCLLHYCQGSFINMLESGFVLCNGTQEQGTVLLLDFNTQTLQYIENGRVLHKVVLFDLIDCSYSLDEIVQERMRQYQAQYQRQMFQVKLQQCLHSLQQTYMPTDQQTEIQAQLAYCSDLVAQTNLDHWSVLWLSLFRDKNGSNGVA